jgi:FADH2 O2-dependent halogenase
MTDPNQPYDVIILGTGFGGSVLATILARHGKRVLMIERNVHPRFAVGESTIPQMTMGMRVLSVRHDIPELDHMTSANRIRKHITSSCGVKRNFGFVYHRPGEPQRPAECNQVGAIHGDDSESHLMRQDIDAYYFYTAVKYGAVPRQNVQVTEIEIEGSGVRVHDSRGNVHRGRYVVDGTGYDSILARKYSLRDAPTRLRTNVRSLFTHMVGVEPYDDHVEPRGAHRMPHFWHQGTLHHIFDGGWLWVIPFDNHEHATNPLCSVGLQLDTRTFPRPEGISPEQEFREFLVRYPSTAAQFARAHAVRDWVSTGRMQFASTRCFGDRFGLLSHAAGFIDPLFSRGLSNTVDVNGALATTLLAALDDDDFSAERFSAVEELQQNLIDGNDKLVASAYIAFRDFELWNAWYRFWGLGSFLAMFRLRSAKMRYDESGDRRFLEQLDHPPCPGRVAPDYPKFNALFETAVAVVAEVEAGQRSAASARDELFAMLRGVDYAPPVYPWTDPNLRFSVADQATIERVKTWVATKAPADIKRLYFDLDVKTHAWLDFTPRDATHPETPMTILDQVKAAMAHVTAGNIDAYLEMLSEDYHLEVNGQPTPVTREIQGVMLKALRRAVPDLDLGVTNLRQVDDKIMFDTMITGTHRDVMQLPGLPPSPPTNRRIKGEPQSATYWIKDGKLVRENIELRPGTDPMHLYRQLGIEQLPG